MKKTILKTNQNHPAIRAYRQALEKGKTSQHVVFQDSGWVIKQADSQSPSNFFNSKGDAVKFAQRFAQNAGTALFIHGVDGKIVDRQDYSL